MDQWMPTTEEVRDRYVYGSGNDVDGESPESFDAWLSEEMAKAYNKGWDAAMEVGD